MTFNIKLDLHGFKINHRSKHMHVGVV